MSYPSLTASSSAIVLWDPKWTPAARRALLQNGYQPTPECGKIPVLEGWQKVNATTEDIAAWEKSHPDAINTGILTRQTPAIDIDVLNQEVAEIIHRWVKELIPAGCPELVRIGLPPKRAILFRCDTPFAKISTGKWIDDEDSKIEHELEILCLGQKITVYGNHPDTGKAYIWTGARPGQTPWSTLPLLTEEMARSLVDRTKVLFKERGWRPKVDERPKEPPRPRATGSADGDARKISAALAERIEELCHALLPNGVKHGCEWDVGSLNGEAGKSLRVHLSGEKAGVWSDFATGGDRGDALELVKATKSYSSVEAMDWARSWLGWPTREPPPQGAKKNTAPGNGPTCSDWPDPKPLPSGLALVDAFNLEFLPDTFAPWIGDISDRLQCPTDYAAIAAIVSFGSVLGRRIGVKPQFKTDWYEVPNLWGCFIGRPGQLKSPAMTEALKPIHRLEAEALKQNEIDQKAYAQGLSAYKIKREVAASLAKKELKQTGKMGDLKFDLDEEPEEPLPTRYRTNDSSYEAIGELLISNPTGILVERDELVSLLMNLDREDQASARGFYLSAWSGKSPYTFDRIVRGHRHIEGACISVLGNTQPARIAEYIRRANVGGAGGDGLIQRFGLMVWPDAPPTWRDVDEYPNPAARERVWQAFERVSKIDLTAALKLGAERGTFDPLPALRFDEAAQAVFREWRSELEERDLRSGKLSPALEGHLAKFRKLVPVLSLINHLADGNEGPIAQGALLKALAFAEYLKSHARRIYGSGDEAELAAAKGILEHIAAGDLKEGFTARDVHRPRWSHLTERGHVSAGLNRSLARGHHPFAEFLRQGWCC